MIHFCCRNFLPSPCHRLLVLMLLLLEVRLRFGCVAAAQSSPVRVFEDGGSGSGLVLVCEMGMVLVSNSSGGCEESVK